MIDSYFDFKPWALQSPRLFLFMARWFMIRKLIAKQVKKRMNHSSAGQLGTRCHAGLDKPAPAIGKPGAPSLDFWIPLRLPVVKINIYNWPLRVVSLSNHDFYPPLADLPE